MADAQPERISGTGLLPDATRRLGEANIPTPQLDAMLLLCAATGFSKTQILTDRTLEIDPKAIAGFEGFLKRRLAGEPVYRIIGKVEFYGREFLTGPDVLLPRQDSEILIDAVLADFPTRGSDHEASSQSVIKILDIGTGTGILALTLAAEFATAKVTAVDVSRDALQLTRRNAKALGVSERVEIIESDLFDRIDGKFDLVVSNPPYIPRAVIDTLACDVREHDPVLALDGGEDGLDFYKCILNQLADFLKPGARAYFEIGYDQGKTVPKLAAASGFEIDRIVKDLGGNDRVVVMSLAK